MKLRKLIYPGMIIGNLLLLAYTAHFFEQSTLPAKHYAPRFLLLPLACYGLFLLFGGFERNLPTQVGWAVAGPVSWFMLRDSAFVGRAGLQSTQILTFILVITLLYALGWWLGGIPKLREKINWAVLLSIAATMLFWSRYFLDMARIDFALMNSYDYFINPGWLLPLLINLVVLVPVFYLIALELGGRKAINLYLGTNAVAILLMAVLTWTWRWFWLLPYQFSWFYINYFQRNFATTPDSSLGLWAGLIIGPIIYHLLAMTGIFIRRHIEGENQHGA